MIDLEKINLSQIIDPIGILDLDTNKDVESILEASMNVVEVLKTGHILTNDILHVLETTFNYPQELIYLVEQRIRPK